MKSQRKNGMTYLMYSLMTPEQARAAFERRHKCPPAEVHIEGHYIYCGPTELNPVIENEQEPSNNING